MAKNKKGASTRKKATVRKAKKAAVSKKAKAMKPKAAQKKAKAAKKSPNATAKRAKAPSGKFNMLVTFNPNHAGTAGKELNEVLKKIGENPRIMLSNIEGLFKVAVSDARKVVSRLKSLCHADPDRFVATHHYTPIDKWCSSEVNEMKKHIKALVPGIGKSDRWRMVLNKRHWDKEQQTQLILNLTSAIDRDNVDLSNPQKIVQVEIIGKEAGISLLQAGETLDVLEIKDKN